MTSRAGTGRRSVIELWPELFAGLTAGQRDEVVGNLAWSLPDEAQPSRAEVDDMVAYVTGQLTKTEYAHRCADRDATRARDLRR